jgi:hypothetical protein
VSDQIYLAAIAIRTNLVEAQAQAPTPRDSTVPAERLRAERPNHIWAFDFQFDQTAVGRTLKLLNIVDEFSRAPCRWAPRGWRAPIPPYQEWRSSRRQSGFGGGFSLKNVCVVSSSPSPAARVEVTSSWMVLRIARAAGTGASGVASARSSTSRVLMSRVR